MQLLSNIMGGSSKKPEPSTESGPSRTHGSRSHGATTGGDCRWGWAGSGWPAGSSGEHSCADVPTSPQAG